MKDSYKSTWHFEGEQQEFAKWVNVTKGAIKLC